MLLNCMNDFLDCKKDALSNKKEIQRIPGHKQTSTAVPFHHILVPLWKYLLEGKTMLWY